MRSSRSIRVLLAWSSSLCATAAKISGLSKVQKGQQDRLYKVQEVSRIYGPCKVQGVSRISGLYT